MDVLLALSPLQIFLIFSFVWVGATVQAALGFGLALIAAPPLLLIHPALIPGPLMAGSIVLTSLIAHRDRAAVDLAGVAWSLWGRLFGTAAAAAFMAMATQRLFDFAFGLLVIAGVGLSLSGVEMVPTPRRAVIAGGFSGLMGTISSIGGPPIALLYQHADAARLRGTISAYFVVGTTLSLLALVAIGRMTAAQWELGAALQIPILVGFACAAPLRARLERAPVRPFVLGLSLASGLFVLGRALVES